MSPIIAPPPVAASKPLPVTDVGPPAPSATAVAERVVVVGAGPVGMAAALELAQRGVASVVLEKRGSVATRENLFNVAPPFADRLAALDQEGSLTRLLVPTERMVSDDQVAGKVGERWFEHELQPDATRSRGDMGALVRAVGPPQLPDADVRRWSKVGIGDLENAMRELARTRHGDLIEFRSDAAVEGVRQGQGWVEAILQKPDGAGGAADAVRGAVLIDASGSDLLGAPRRVYPEQSHWIGGRFAAPTDSGTGTLRRRAPEPGDTPRVTIKLPTNDRTMVWAQVAGDARAVGPEERAALLERRAAQLGVGGGLVDRTRTAPVTVQLWETTEAAAGRVLKVGDSVRAPYFPTSTGAAAGIVHDAPRAVDAALRILQGADPQAVASTYDAAVKAANSALVATSRKALLADIGVDPTTAAAPTIVHQRSEPAPGASPHAA